MTAPALLSLAERVEAASGADRELDALIWCALNGKKYRGHNEAPAYYGTTKAETQVEFTEPPKRTRLVTGRPSLPHAQPVTGSLDAAMTLVPENYTTNLHFSGCAHFRPAVKLWLHGTTSYEGDIEAEAATPALALCAASLRALAAAEDKSDD